MSTRGAYGFYKSGIKKIAFNRWDSYPSGLGQDIISYIVSKSIQELNKDFESINLVIDTDSLSPEAYDSLEQARGSLTKYAKIGLMLDESEFLKDHLFCEWAYIINLDTNTLEVYQSGDSSLIRELAINEDLQNNWKKFVSEIEG